MVKMGIMKRLLVAAVLIGVVDVVVGQQCKFNVTFGFGSSVEKFFKITKEWFHSLVQKLKSYVTKSKLPECSQCASIRPSGQKTVAAVKDEQTGCRCNTKENYNKLECACCFRLYKWDFLICLLSGFTVGSKEVFFILTVETEVIFEITISLESWWMEMLALLTRCIPLPYPVQFLSVCVEPSMKEPTADNNFTWSFCFQLSFGILQVPVIHIRPKCFQVGGKNESQDSIRANLPGTMKIQGQSDPKVDVDKPAETEVLNENYNSMVCLTNSRKKRSKDPTTRSEALVVTPPLINDKINWQRSIPGQTPYLAVLRDKTYPKKITRIHRNVTTFQLIEKVLTRADEEQWMKDETMDYLYVPEKTCGGAILSPKKVLTLCACIRTFYFIHVLGHPPSIDSITPFDILSTDIFLEFSHVIYEAAETHYLTKNNIATDSSCAKNIVKGDKKIMETTMVVMEFAPEIKNPNPTQFVQWPPMKMVDVNDAVLVGFSMQPVKEEWVFSNKSGELIDLDDEAVDIFMKSCPLTDYARSARIAPDADGEEKTAPFCSSKDNFQLCGGTIGQPVTTSGSPRRLIGLSGLPIDCSKEGSIIVVVFDDEAVREISRYVSGAPPDSTDANTPSDQVSSASRFHPLEGFLLTVPLVFRS